MAKEPLTTGIAYRIGWAIYWVCIIVACLWVGAIYLYLTNSIPEGGDFPWRFFAVVGGSGALLAYAAGRLLLYVLSDE
jgi:hypothetical protein